MHHRSVLAVLCALAALVLVAAAATSCSIPNCAKCSEYNPDYCEVCPYRYLFNYATKRCELYESLVADDCNEWNQQNPRECLACHTETTLTVYGTCTPQPGGTVEGCTLLSADVNDTCVECAQNYELNQSTGKCARVQECNVENCVVCSATNSSWCVQCRTSVREVSGTVHSYSVDAVTGQCVFDKDVDLYAMYDWEYGYSPLGCDNGYLGSSDEGRDWLRCVPSGTCFVPHCASCSPDDPLVCLECTPGNTMAAGRCLPSSVCTSEGLARCLPVPVTTDYCKWPSINFGDVMCVVPDYAGHTTSRCVSSNWAPDYCVYCGADFKPDPWTGRCTRSDDCTVENCTTCSHRDAGWCVECDKGLTLTKYGTCTPGSECNVAYCAACAPANSSVCQKCVAGTTLDPITNKCVADNSGCSVDHCLSCMPDCHIGAICRACDDGYTVDSTSGRCVPLGTCNVDHCVQCADRDPNWCDICDTAHESSPLGICVDKIVPHSSVAHCAETLPWDSTWCAACLSPQAYFIDPTSGRCTNVAASVAACEEAGGAQVNWACSYCRGGYTLGVHGECEYQGVNVTCDDEACAICEGNTTVCTGCVIGYTLKDGECVQDDLCDVSGCMTCTPHNSSFCSVCKQPKVMDPLTGQCESFGSCFVDNCDECLITNPRACSVCSDGFVTMSGDGECHSMTATDIPHCTLWALDETVGYKCIGCESGYTTDEGYCRTVAALCDQCVSGQIPDPATGKCTSTTTPSPTYPSFSGDRAASLPLVIVSIVTAVLLLIV